MSEKRDTPDQAPSKEGTVLSDNDQTVPVSRTSTETSDHRPPTATEPAKLPNPEDKVYLTGVKLVLVFVYALSLRSRMNV